MNKSLLVAALFFGLVALASATTYFQEDFDDSWESRWVYSQADTEEQRGTFVHTAGKFAADPSDKGIQTGQDARFYKLSTTFPAFSNKDKDLVLQYTVKNEQKLDCGGGYIKLLPPGFDQTNFKGDTAYNIMFGPDVCGSRRVHAIFNYKGENYLTTKSMSPKSDQATHVYTMIIHPNQTVVVKIDNKQIAEMTLEEDWDIFPEKEIPDPNESKPADWVDEPMIPDPEAVKPEGWDDIPATIPDPEATKPEDWDDELDGEWEAPMNPNPEYKGEWEAPLIENPAYKGEWVHPKIPNPDYFHDSEAYAYEHGGAAFEIWQVTSGTIFDHILVTDSVEEATAAAEAILAKTEAEEEARKKWQEEEDAKAKAEAEAEAAQFEAEAAEDEDDDDDDDDSGADNKDLHDEL
ncbi:Calreticulin [Balamuthia mandrillaris]